MMILLLACSTAPKKDALDSSFDSLEKPSYILESTLENGDILQTIDIDQDGQTDVWNTFYLQGDGTSRLLVKKELDINHDGISDIISTYDDKGRVVEEAFDMNFDQIRERIEYYHYSGDKVSTTTKKDINGDGIFDIKQEIRDGVLYRVEMDTTGDQMPDLWQALDKNGKVEKYVMDTDGDGIMDVRVE
jgi:antitoxin component YwqK of YwqJK toxin-antitoxin module